MDTTKTITHLGLCAGYGGIELGLKRVLPNLRSVALCEIEAFACANLVAKMEAGLMEPAPIWTDLKTFPWAEFSGRVDILTGGYPCQPFSAAGKRLGTDDPRHLWPFIASGIRILRPKLCFFENVEGHISLGLREVIGELEQMGYKVSWGIFSAREVGAPHQRKRVFILAHLSSERLERYRAVWIKKLHESHSEKIIACGNSQNVWPSRPGEPQHAWEPPRVVADCKKFGWSSQRIIGDLGEKKGSETSRGHQPTPTTSDCSNAGAEAMGNASELFSDGSHNHARVSERSEEIPQSGNSSWEAMGNPECIRISASREHGAMDEAIGIPADRKGSESAQADPEPSAARKREGHGADASERGETKPAMGGDADGSSDRMDYAKLCVSCDNRTDELRLLGNGVVPATAERAFRTLLEELNK